MTANRSRTYLIGLVRELCKEPSETEWVEFKHNDKEPQEIGEYISALSNSAALAGKANAYIVWGIDDTTHAIIGTTFSPRKARAGGEELESWLLRLLDPKIHFTFSEFSIDRVPVVLLEISRALTRPVQFKGQEYIRVGSYKKPLKGFPEKERELWRIFDQTPFETNVALADISSSDVLKLLDYPAYFDLLGLPLPEHRSGILQALEAEGFIAPTATKQWNITNLGAALIAKSLHDFPTLRRKTIRIIVYKDDSRIETQNEIGAARGYASGFDELMALVNGLIPASEVIGQARRETVSMYPPPAVRELVANALIHQDFVITGTSPTIEFFSDRIEITNPGAPLVAKDRLLDMPPRSRNEALASFMRRVGFCEERGSGIDKVVFQTELYQLPPPEFEVAGENMRVILFAHRPLNRMDREDRVRACYLHACLRYVNRKFMTNSSLRERFGIESRNSALASRLIKEAVDDGLVCPDDPGAANKLMRYVPCWAKPGGSGR